MTKRCFVIQGFGKKQDYAQGKLFDLDASYQVIKEAVEEAGLECYRADELRTNAVIDQVMYDQLLSADLVVADITTLNFNAAYELGVRFALRPYATLVVGEDKMNFPFDVNHVYIHRYQHLGEDIGRKEYLRFKKELKHLVEVAVSNQKKDSPVYIFLKDLPEKGFTPAEQPKVAPVNVAGSGATLRELTDQARQAMQDSRFTEAVGLWQQARAMVNKDDYIVQQQALAMYKSKQPDAVTALRKAENILAFLQPHGSFDTETLGIWAAIHKRLYEITNDGQDLDETIFALERGFFIKKDYYNGINLAFMLDIKAHTLETPHKSEIGAFASYVRREVKNICNKTLRTSDYKGDDLYWIKATLYEACVGLGEVEEAGRWQAEAGKLNPPEWMRLTTENQVARLRELLKQDL